MPHVQLSDAVYQQAVGLARDYGFGSVDDFVAEVLAGEAALGVEDFDALFTPERLALLDEASRRHAAGAAGHSLEEVQAHFMRKSAAWPESQVR